MRAMHRVHARLGLALLLFGLALTAAAGTTTGERAAAYAQKMVGTPYRYGGASPKGFDCSGLVQYSYRHAGLALPHNTEALRRMAKHIRLAELRRGDLVFFDQRGIKNSHVAIYVGNGHIVHAPSTGKRVRMDRISSPYWRKHISEARRIAA
jgi:cell wall-associated NlpC family hydrolase